MSEWDFLWDIDDDDEIFEAMTSGATKEDWDYIEELECQRYGFDGEGECDARAIVLIDAESVAYTYADSINKKLSSIGDIKEVRYYARQKDPVTAKWKDVAKKYGYKPILMFGEPEKNKIDNKIIKDAKKFCSSDDDIEVYVLVSKDGDYTELVKYLRKCSKKVIIMGPKNTSKRLKKAGNENIMIKNGKKKNK